MKQADRIFFIPLCFYFFFLFTSCNKNEIEPTRLNGKPSMVKQDNQTKTFFYYTGNKIAKIKEKRGSVYKFNYTGEELTSIDVSPEDRRVEDGIGTSTFTREGNKIIIHSSGAPSLDIVAIKELELDANETPVKLTDLGFFRQTSDGLKKEADGTYYTLFTFNPLTGSLWKQKTYDIYTGELTASCSYEYDNASGMLNRVDMPLWFYAYWLHLGKHFYWDPLKALFHNYANNLQTVIVSYHKEEEKEMIANYQYQYNQYEYPFFIENDYPTNSMFTISY